MRDDQDAAGPSAPTVSSDRSGPAARMTDGPELVTADGPDLPLAHVRDWALVATDRAFTITDARHPDNALLWVNPAFSRMTGYSSAESLGHNCRFLQGPATDPGCVDLLRQAVTERRQITLTLLNYRKDGSTFWNELSVSPVFDHDGALVSFVGVQSDVSERVRFEAERTEAYAAEHLARRDAEAARRRLAMLAEATIRLAATLDVGGTVDRLADLIVPELADWVVITLVDEDGTIEQTLGRHRSVESAVMDRYAELLRDAMTEHSGTRRILAGSDPILHVDAAVAGWRHFTDSDELADIVTRLGVHSIMYVPLVARGRRILGSVTFVSGSSGREFSEEDLAVAVDLGRRAGLTLDNARLYEHEHRVAETLQRSLLPDLPPIAGLQVEARYLPGDADADVGGDFYELLPLPDGSVGFAAGDVVGHDLVAAAAMGHLRGLLRACAWNGADDGRGDPTEVVDRVDRLVQGLDLVPLATLVYGRLERPADIGGPWRFTYANAGHPPPLLHQPDGSVEILDEAEGVLLGVVEHAERRSVTVDLHAGASLIAYTDGLIERRGESLDRGLDRLTAALAGTAPDTAATVERLVATLGPERSDDTAVIVVHVLPSPRTD